MNTLGNSVSVVVVTWVTYVQPHTNKLFSKWSIKSNKKIIDEIKTGKNYSILVNSSTEISHVDQLSLVIRNFQENGELIK